MDLLEKTAQTVTKLFTSPLGISTALTSDAEESGTITRSPSSTLLPSTPSNPDLTASTPSQNKRPLSSGLEVKTGDNRFVKRQRVAGDESKGSADTNKKSRSAPIPVPNPLFWSDGYKSKPNKMPKPGASHSFKPLTYSNKGKPRATTNTYSSNEVPPLPYSKSQRSDYSEVDQEVVDADINIFDIRRSPSTLPPARSGRQNGGSGHSTGARRGLQSTNEFEATNSILYQRQKTPRSNKSPGTNSSKHRIGQDEMSAIVVLDDEPEAGKMSTARRLQLNAFEQGIPPKSISRAQAKNTGTVSPYFSSDNAKPNKARQRHDALTHQDESPNLRDNFKRFVLDSNSSEDELAAGAPKTTGKPKSAPKQHKTGLVFTPKKTEDLPSRGWQLDWARTHDYEETRPGLSLMKGTMPQTWRVVGTDDGTRHTRFHLPLSKIISAESDGMSRIRLQGSRDASNVRGEYDLQFSDPANLEAFMSTGELTKVNTKPEEYMKKVFQKPLPTRRENSRPTAWSEPQLESRKSERPQKTGMIDALQASSSTSENVPGSRSTMVLNGNASTNTRPARTTRANQPTSGESDPEPKEKIKYSERVGLGQPWKRQLTYGTGRRRAVIDFSDLLRLDEEEFLNDSLIDFYMIYLFDHSGLPSDKVYFFNTHFFSTLTRKVAGHKKAINYAGVSRWTAKEDIFDYDYIVVPINQDLHWYLAIICNVRNINRKLSIDGADQPSVPLEVTGEADHVQVIELDNRGSTSHSTSPKPSCEPETLNQAPNSDDEMLFDGNSKLDLVDPHVITDSKSPAAVPQPDILEGFGDAEVARTNKSTLLDQDHVKMTSQDAATSSLSKKSKRRPPPPAKRYDPDEPCIIILDSLGNSTRSGAVRALKDYIAQEGKAKRGMDAIIDQNAFYAKGNQIPMQNNYSDCGLYVLGYIKQFFKDPDDFKNRLLTKEMSSHTDWPDLSATKMRDEIRKLLFELHDAQDNERKRVHIANARQNAAKPPSKPSDNIIATTEASPRATENVRKSQETSALAVEHTDHQHKGGDAKPVINLSPTMNDHSKAEDVSQRGKPITTEAAPMAKPRLGSPFELRPTVKSNTAASVHPVEPFTRAHRTPETVRRKDTDGQSKSSEKSGRKTSPRVVVTSRSPSLALSNKRKRADVISEIQILSPGKSTGPGLGSKQSPSRNETSFSSPSKKVKTAMSNDMRGSSADPITIEDSQDTIVPSPTKKLPRPSVRDGSPDSVIVMPPDERSRPGSGMHNHRSERREMKHRSGADKKGLMIEDSSRDQMTSSCLPTDEILPL